MCVWKKACSCHITRIEGHLGDPGQRGGRSWSRRVARVGSLERGSDAAALHGPGHSRQGQGKKDVEGFRGRQVMILVTRVRFSCYQNGFLTKKDFSENEKSN